MNRKKGDDSTIGAFLDPDAHGLYESFFERNTKPREEIIEGMIREQQLGAFAGPYGIGKSPALADIAMHALNGIPWCGRAVEARPVIHFDFETPAPTYKANLQNIAARLGVSVPTVPGELDVYLEHDHPDEPGTKKLLDALQSDSDARLALIEASLNEKPDALVIIDPLELLFPIDTGKKQQVIELYAYFRQLLSRHPRAALLKSRSRANGNHASPPQSELFSEAQI